MPSPLSHRDRLLRLAKKKGLLRASDLAAEGIPRIYLTRLTAEGALTKAGPGLYRLPDTGFTEHEGMVLVAARAPQVVFCLLTALSFHELTTQLPWQVWIALPQGGRPPRMEFPPLRTTYYSGPSFTEGIETHRVDGVDLRVYCAAKTVADCFKYRSKIGLDVALEALRDARRERKATPDQLWHYAKVCRVASVMSPYLEATA